MAAVQMSTQTDGLSGDTQTKVFTPASRTNVTIMTTISTSLDFTNASVMSSTETGAKTENTCTMSDSRLPCILKCTNSCANKTADANINVPYKVNRKLLSSYRRTHCSANDTRMSSFYIGCIVIFQVIGLVFNAVFIHISYKGSDKHSDVTLLLASCTQLGQALVTLVKYIYVLVCRDDNTSLQWYFIFDPLDFLFRGLYICFTLSLSTARYVVLKKIEIPRNSPMVSRSKTRQWLPFPIVLVAFCIFLLMITMEIPDISRYVTIYFLQVAFIGIPMLSFVILTTFLILYVLKIVHKRQTMMDRHLKRTSNRQRSQQNVTGRLLQQAIYSILYHIVFMALPYSYVVVMDMCVVNITGRYVLRNTSLFFHYVEAILPIFNPISLGIFLKKNRKSLQSCLKAIQDLAVRMQPLQPIFETQELQLVPNAINEFIESQKEGCQDISRIRVSKLSATSSSNRSVGRQRRLSSTDSLYYSPDLHFLQSDHSNDDRYEVNRSSINSATTCGTLYKAASQSSTRSNGKTDRLSVASLSSYASSSGRRISILSASSTNPHRLSIDSVINVYNLPRSISMLSDQSTEEAIQNTITFF
ncbi:PTHR1 [Mytilus edulis]|uniref:PTHR1 n=1 Tax=Mytilus edulis TaxID=6550 RepID=A0A8S3PXN1_MYTED|nr:PTHR1 [Mytilus edulis]